MAIAWLEKGISHIHGRGGYPWLCGASIDRNRIPLNAGCWCVTGRGLWPSHLLWGLPNCIWLATEGNKMLVGTLVYAPEQDGFVPN